MSELTIYRFMSFEQFVDMIASRRMYLTQLLRWDDPHEAQTMRQLVKDFLSKEPATVKFSTRVRDEVLNLIHKSLYGQSWTTLEESDALWRIYSPDKMGIRISAAQADALASIQHTDFSKEEDVEIFVGNVGYISPENAWAQVRKKVEKEGISKYKMRFADLCFYKREQFSHEKEYRFCAFIPPKGFDLDLSKIDPAKPGEEDRVVALLKNYNFPPIYYYPFDPKQIRDVTLDPRAPDWFLESTRNLFSSYGKKNLVRRSALYERPAV